MSEEIFISPYEYLKEDYFGRNASSFKQMTKRRRQETLRKAAVYFKNIKEGIEGYYRRPKDAFDPRFSAPVRQAVYLDNLEAFRKRFDVNIWKARGKGFDWIFFENFKDDNGEENDILSYALRHNIFGMGHLTKDWFVPYINFFAKGKSAEQLNSLLFFIGAEKRTLTAINSLSGTGADLRFVEETTGNTALMAFFERPKKTVWISAKDEEARREQDKALFGLFEKSFLANKPALGDGCFYFPRNKAGKNIFDMLLENGYTDELKILSAVCVSQLEGMRKDLPEEFNASVRQVKEALPLDYMMLRLVDNMKGMQREEAAEGLYLLQMAVNGFFRKVSMEKDEETGRFSLKKEELPAPMIMLERVCEKKCWDDLKGYASVYRDGSHILRILDKTNELNKALKKLERANAKKAAESLHVEGGILPVDKESDVYKTNSSEMTKTAENTSLPKKENDFGQEGKNMPSPREEQKLQTDENGNLLLFSDEELNSLQVVCETLSRSRER